MGYDRNRKKWVGYIYVILNDIHPDKIYVGQTYTSLETRWRSHVSEIKDHTPTDKLHNAMELYGVEHFAMEPIGDYKADTKKELITILDEKEIYYVDKFNSYYHGYNATKGGRNGSEYKLKPVEKYSLYGELLEEYESVESLKEEYQSVSTIYDCCLGNCKYAYGYIWRYKGSDLPLPILSEDEIKEAMVRKNMLGSFDEYDYKGNLVKIYHSLEELLLFNEDLTRKQIVNCCTGLRSTVGLKVFRFHGESFYKYKTVRNQFKIVEQYDLELNFIKAYFGVREAGRETNITWQSIQMVCIGKKNTAGGYIWKYAENIESPSLKRDGHCKTVYQYSKIDFTLLNTYIGLNEASNSSGEKINTISRIARGKVNAINSKYVWSYIPLTQEEIKNPK